jgi:ribosome-associated translation inhibitor RaiA
VERNDAQNATQPLVELVGQIAPDLVDYAREKLTAVLSHTGRRALRVHLRVIRYADPGRERPVSARANVDLDGVTLQVHCDAVTPREAVDRLIDRLDHRLERV